MSEAAARSEHEGRVPRIFIEFLVCFSAVWIVSVLVRGVMFWLLVGTPFPLPSLSLIERLGLMGYQFAVIVPAAFVTATAVMAIPHRSGGWRANTMAAIAVAIAVSLELLRFGGWASYYSTEQFLSAESWSLIATTASQIIAHVLQSEAWILVAVPIAALLVFAGTVAICRSALRMTDRRQRALVAGVGATIAVSVVAAWYAHALSEADAARIVTHRHQPAESAHEAWVSAAKETSGPIARLLAELVDEVESRSAGMELWKSGPTTRRRVISMDDYAALPPEQLSHRWNVVFVVVESMRADALTAIGGPRVVMPALEQLAREATVYTDATTQATQSDYSTTATLASQYPLRTPRYRTFPDVIPYPRVLLYDLLRARGWRTGVFSSQNELWAGMYSFLNTGGVDHFLHSETFRGETHADPGDFGFWNWMKSAKERAGKIDDADTMTEAIKWIDSVGLSAPFLAYLNLQSPHTPYVRPPSFPPRFGSGHVSFPIRFGGYPIDSVQAVRDMYDNSLAYVDAQLGRLVAALKSSGRWESTVIVVTADHGEAFFEHGFAAHGNKLYREVTHIPMVIRVPGRLPARDSLAAASIDLVPTIVGLLGLPPHPAFQGLDLADTALRKRRPVYSLSQTALADEVAVEENGWCLHYDLRHSEQHLFDLRNDPDERIDVSSANEARRNRMADLVSQWWNSQLGYYQTLRPIPRFYPPLQAFAAP
jgi:arylsulfatase A-like enzyme